MSNPTHPSELARETLKMLAARKLPPTPEHYAQVYHEIAGNAAAAPPHPPPTAAADDAARPAPAWPQLIRELLKQLDTTHRGISLSRKKDGVQTVLKNFSSNGDALFEKLQGLMASWSAAPTVPALDASDLAPADPVGASAATAMPDVHVAPSALPVAAPPPPAAAGRPADAAAPWRELLASALEQSAAAATAGLHDDGRRLADQVRAAVADEPPPQRLSEQVRQHGEQIEFIAHERAHLQDGAIRLLRLLVNNVGELSTDDDWLHGQVEVLRDLLARPMDKLALADAERSLRDTIIQQGALRQGLIDSRATLKQLLSRFVDSLAEVTEHTGEYQTKIEGFSQRIGRADKLSDVSQLLDDILRETRVVQTRARQSHDELVSTRRQADEAEQRVRQLERELARVSEKMHEDQLTGALNRRGMDEALNREISRSDRQATPISLALLDVDNFKQLNDTLGHQAGDRSLVHLTTVIRQTLRPTDTVARYGGEEFIIIMSETALQVAIDTITRLQRELTKNLFLHNDARQLITFSAGVALRGRQESAAELINRADKAMYQAKKAGKNRVVAAD